MDGKAYIEMTVEEARKLCKKNAKVLVAVVDLKVNVKARKPAKFKKMTGESAANLIEKDDKIVKYENELMEQLDIYKATKELEKIRNDGELLNSDKIITILTGNNKNE